MILCFTEIIREVKSKGPNLNELLKTPLNLLEDDCLNSALLAAIKINSPKNIFKLILRGAINIDEALHKIRKVILIEICRRYNSSAVREELLLRTDVDKDGGTVLWFGLHLTQLEISWLRSIH